MANIYTNKSGEQVYDNAGQTYSAKTGQVYTASPTIPTPTTGSANMSTIGTPTITPTQVAQTPAYIPPNAGNAADINKQVQDAITGYKAQSANDQKSSAMFDQLNSLQGQLSGEGARRAQLNQQNDLSGKISNLNNLSNQFSALDNLRQSTRLQIQNEFSGTGATTAGVSAYTERADRELAVKQLGVSAMLRAAQGDVATAQLIADEAIKAEFDPIRQQIQTATTNLQLIQPYLDREDKKKSDNLNILLAERTRVLNEQQQNAQTINNYTLEAAKNEAPPEVLAQAKQAQNPMEALQLLGKYMSNPMDKQLKQAQIAQSNAATSLAYANIANVKANTAKTNAEVKESGSKAITPETMDARTAVISSVNSLLAGGKINAISGIKGISSYNGGWGNTALAMNQMKQLGALLALEARFKLKGTGAISNFEQTVLNNSTSALGDITETGTTNLSNAKAAQELKNVRGVLMTISNMPAVVIITDPKTGVSRTGEADRAMIQSATLQGMTIQYE